MSPTPLRPDLPDLTAAIEKEVQQEVARLAASPEVRSAFNWFRRAGRGSRNAFANWGWTTFASMTWAMCSARIPDSGDAMWR
jgi:hypothetical protein